MALANILIRAGALIALALALFLGHAHAQAEDTIPWQGIERHYVLYRPGGLAPSAPLVIVLQGLEQDLDSVRQWLPIEPVADKNHFAVVYPEAIGLRWSYWRGGGIMLPNDPKQEIDDVGFIAALVDKLVKDKLVDPARVYLTGISRGALMSWTLACERADLFAAVAPLSSAMTAWHQTNCHPTRLVPVIAVDGTTDPVQRYDGFLYPPSSPPVPRLLSVPETLAFWWQSHGCTGESIKSMPHLNTGDVTRIVQYEWTGCTKGGTVKLYRVNNGGHIPPSFSREGNDDKRFGFRSRDMETAAAIWQDFIASR